MSYLLLSPHLNQPKEEGLVIVMLLLTGVLPSVCVYGRWGVLVNV